MKAVTLAPGRSVIMDVPEPTPGPQQILIRVHAAGMNRSDLLRVQGGFHGAAEPAGTIIGTDFAGEVIGPGDGVTRFKPGDRVMCAGRGAWAEQAVAHQDDCMAIPQAMAFEQAAVLPVALRTMHNALVTHGRLKGGQSVMIKGATSGVGLLGLTAARYLGAGFVIGSTTRDERFPAIKAAGADLAVNQRNGKWVEAVKEATGGKGVDVIVDQISGAGVNDLLKVAAIKGRIVNVGRLGGGHADFDFEMHAAKQISYIGVTFRTRTPEEVREITEAAYAALGDGVRSGAVRVPVDRVFPLGQAGDALNYMRDNAHVGKIALKATGR
jgi:NADPH2:quinone reductase